MSFIPPQNGKVIIVAHKVPLDDSGNLKSGGMASAIMAAMEDHGSCLWIGANEDKIDSPSERDGKPLITSTARGVDFASFPLTERENTPFYQQMSNEGLWPLMHELDGKITEDGTAFQQYRNVNNLYAKELMSVLGPNDVIWVHDYHLVPLASSLRSMGVQNPIMFFNHIPLPSKTFVDNADCNDALKRQFSNLVEMLFEYDMVGLQSVRDLQNLYTFIDSEMPEKYSAFDVVQARHEGRKTNVGVFPIGIEVDKVQDIVAKNREAKKVKEVIHMLTKLDGSQRKLIVGADRLDYTKGLIQRAKGTGLFLQNTRDTNVQFLYATPYSRDKIEAYVAEKQAYRGELAKVNLEHGDASWVPILTESRNIPRDELFAIYNLANVGIVSSINDGMHLGAHEFTAAQNPHDPGVLVLSDNVGASEIFKGAAVLYNPKNPQELAEAYKRAISMQQDERLELHSHGMDTIRKHSANVWATSNLSALVQANG